MSKLAPMSVAPNGQQIATGLPGQHSGFSQNIEGGLLEGAAKRTAASIKAQAGHAKAAGITMRGGGLTEYHPLQGAEGGTISGVSSSKNYGNLLQSVNSLRTAASYDHLGGTTPYKVSGGKRRRKTKKNGRRNRRSSKRNIRKHSNRSRRNNKSSK